MASYTGGSAAGAPAYYEAGADGVQAGGESIYSWIKEEVRPPPKQPRYQSKFRGTNEVPASTLNVKKAPAATFGRQTTVSPGEFLKSGAKTGKGVDPASIPAKFERAEAARKPQVPTRAEAPVHGLRTNKNFVVANAVENILTAPRPTKSTQPDYRHKADYGQVPAYLEEVKSQITAERELIHSMLQQQEAQEAGPEMVEMSEEERTELIKALKAKWDAVNAQYQLITFKRVSSSNATVGAIRRKEECERQLAQLEKDIERLSAKGPIVVVADS